MTWEIDPFHSAVEFSATHLMINAIKGRFSEWGGTIHLDSQQPEKSWVKAQVNTASIQTGVAQRDAHLRSAAFLEVVRYPLMTFESTHVKLIDRSRAVVTGNFSLHGVTRPIAFNVEYTGTNRDSLTDAWHVGLLAVATIDRRDFGMTFDQINAGVILVGYKINIEIHAEAALV
ncbi:MAG: YceI family protein [Ktedonobacteraceae bacterium]|nr:YceI family protein [Ktedonobacteraceae bacterium]